MGRKRKVQEADSPDPLTPEVRNSANERERDRMRVLSKAFVKLKTTLPWVPPDTKLSKLDTLRLATCYIAHLRQILDEDEAGADADTRHSSTVEPPDNNNGPGFTHPINLTWPFSFQGKPPANGSSSPPPLCQQSQHEQITAS